MDRVDSKVLEQVYNMEMSECDDKWSELVKLMVGTALRDKGACDRHSTACSFPEVDVQVEGSPCVDWSTVGKGQGRQGPNAKALLAALLAVAATQPRCYIHENVPNFDVSIIEAVLGQVCDVFPISVSPADAGHVECSRSRVYTVCIHKTKCKQVAAVDLMYLKLLDSLRGTVVNVEDALIYKYLYIYICIYRTLIIYFCDLQIVCMLSDSHPLPVRRRVCVAL